MVLKELTLLPGVSGNEDAVRDYVLEKVRPLADEVTVDMLGNVICKKYAKKPGENKRTVAVAAHMDEVGLIIVGINESGLLSYAPVGGIDPRCVVSKRVFIGKDRVPGVIGAKAIHLQTAEDLTRVLPHEKLYVDIGAKDKSDAEKYVSPGDYAAFDSDWVEFGAGLVKAKALDDRVGVSAMLSALGGEYPNDLVCVFSTQEEIGSRGALVAGWRETVDCAIALEGTSANDVGDVPEHLRVGDVGKGVCISFMDNTAISHPGLCRALRDVADEGGIPWQVKRFVSGGNDARAFQLAHGACPVAVLSVPCRYIHSPSSVAALSDIDAQRRLVEAFLQSDIEI